MNFLVSGLINPETTVRVSGFPLAYNLSITPSGACKVGFPAWDNISRLTVLGDTVQFLSLVGTDQAGTMAAHALAADGIPAENVLAQLPQTAHSAILYDETGQPPDSC